MNHIEKMKKAFKNGVMSLKFYNLVLFKSLVYRLFIFIRYIENIINRNLSPNESRRETI